MPKFKEPPKGRTWPTEHVLLYDLFWFISGNLFFLLLFSFLNSSRAYALSGHTLTHSDALSKKNIYLSDRICKPFSKYKSPCPYPSTPRGALPHMLLSSLSNYCLTFIWCFVVFCRIAIYIYINTSRFSFFLFFFFVAFAAYFFGIFRLFGMWRKCDIKF